MARVARLRVAAAVLRTAAVTMVASDFLLDFEFLGDSCGALLQGQTHLQSQVAALMHGLALSASAAEATKTAETAAKRSAASEQIGEDVAKLREDIVHRHVLIAATASSTHACKTELIVALTLLRIMQYVVGLSRLLELGFSLFLLGLGLVALTVGVIFDGHFLVRRLDLLLGSILSNAKDLIVISFLICHIVHGQARSFKFKD